ncbi:MAG: hypothetical protein K0R57_6234 [Paenibacillaceae bacterium]|nr:hypothetical protein [Paenibacillaceae bacterium]
MQASFRMGICYAKIRLVTYQELIYVAATDEIMKQIAKLSPVERKELLLTLKKSICFRMPMF